MTVGERERKNEEDGSSASHNCVPSSSDTLKLTAIKRTAVPGAVDTHGKTSRFCFILFSKSKEGLKFLVSITSRGRTAQVAYFLRGQQAVPAGWGQEARQGGCGSEL